MRSEIVIVIRLTRPLDIRRRQILPKSNATTFDAPEIAYMRRTSRAEEVNKRDLLREQREALPMPAKEDIAPIRKDSMKVAVQLFGSIMKSVKIS